MAPVRKVLLVLLVGAAIAAGCESESSTPSATSSPTPERAEPDCPNQDSVTNGARSPGSLSGDVDGDGSDDRVFLAVDADAPEGCKAFLVAETEGGALAEEISDPDISFDLGLPTLEGITQVDARPGAEVVVRILSGASTLFVGLFTVNEGELERIEIEGDTQYGNLFPSGGSVGHLEGSDCIEDGIVVSLAVPKGKGYDVTRTFYSLTATRAEPTGSATEFVRPRSLNRYPEFAGVPFSTCG